MDSTLMGDHSSVEVDAVVNSTVKISGEGKRGFQYRYTPAPHKKYLFYPLGWLTLVSFSSGGTMSVMAAIMAF